MIELLWWTSILHYGTDISSKLCASLCKMNKNALEVIYISINNYTTSFFIVQFEWRRAQLSVLNHEEKNIFFFFWLSLLCKLSLKMTNLLIFIVHAHEVVVRLFLCKHIPGTWCDGCYRRRACILSNKRI